MWIKSETIMATCLVILLSILIYDNIKVTEDPLVPILIRMEGSVIDPYGNLIPYTDSLGNLTAGYGHLILTPYDAKLLLQHDIENHRQDLYTAFPWVKDIPIDKQEILINMSFNMGLTNLKSFTKMLKAVKAEDYITASREMLYTDGHLSRWHTQVGNRAVELAEKMKLNP